VEPPRRALLRIAGVLTQLTGAACLLLGTIALVLLMVNKSGGAGLVAVWVAGAMATLVVGGFVYRGALPAHLGGAVLDATFGGALLAVHFSRLRDLFRILPEDDVTSIAGGLHGAAIVMLVGAAACLAAIPQGRTYARWLVAATPPPVPATTQPGFPPPPIAARTGTVIIVPAGSAARRRGFYAVMGALAIGVGIGMGVLVSASTNPARVVAAAGSGSGSAAPPKVAAAPAPATTLAPAPAPAPTGSAGSAGSAAVAVATGSGGSAEVPAPTTPTITGSPTDSANSATGVDASTPQKLVVAERTALAHGDASAFAALASPKAFALGVNAGELADGREAIAQLLRADLGELPPDTLLVQSNFLAIGQERDHAWIAEDLELTGNGGFARHYTISQLAHQEGGQWRFVALAVAVPVPDETAERRAVLGTLPRVPPIADVSQAPADLDIAAHAAFATRGAFSSAFSERPDAFNFGSAPGEHTRGGGTVSRIFDKMRADLKQTDGMRIVGGGAWDPAQKASPWIGVGLVNVAFTTKSRAGTDVTQTFRVLAVFLAEGGAWKIVQSHFSNAGPI
jgi:hypothetical protein